MKYIAAALIGGFFFTAAISQSRLDTFRVGFDAVCTDDETFANTLSQFDEQPLAVSTSFRSDGGASLTFGAVLFVNPKTGTWTMAERIEPNVICVIGMGENFRPYQSDPTHDSGPAT